MLIQFNSIKFILKTLCAIYSNQASKVKSKKQYNGT